MASPNVFEPSERTMDDVTIEDVIDTAVIEPTVISGVPDKPVAFPVTFPTKPPLALTCPLAVILLNITLLAAPTPIEVLKVAPLSIQMNQLKLNYH